jgi:hypothetical protein
MSDPLSAVSLSSSLKALMDGLNDGRLKISPTESMALVAPDPRGFALFRYVAQSLEHFILRCEELEQQLDQARKLIDKHGMV